MAQSKYTTEEQIEAMRREIEREKLKRSGNDHKGKAPGTHLSRGKWLMKAAGGAVFSLLVLLLVFSIVTIYITKSKGEVPSIAGLELFEVESGSMEPTLNVGTVILSRKPGVGSGLKVGEVVTFRTVSGAIVTHRIIEVIKNNDGSVAYRTKGDNPVNSPDQDLLSPDRVIGVFVAKVPLT